MSILSFGRNRPKFKALLGIRARLVLLALILVVPLMVDRVRILEETRTKEVAVAAKELSDLAKQTADSQREVLSSVKAVLKSAAYIYTAAYRAGRPCAIIRSGMQIDMPSIRSISVLNNSGIVQCSTAANATGLDLSDRDYFRQARAQGNFVLSDYVISRASGEPIIMAVYPVPPTADGPEATIMAAVDLKWMSQLMSERVGRNGVSVFLVDSKSVILGAQTKYQDLVGTHLRDTNLLEAITRTEINLDREFGSISFVTADGETRAVSFARIAGTNARLIVSVNETLMLGDIDQKITLAYIQLAFVALLALIGAWIVGERLIIKPIRVMTDAANDFGHGDLEARAPRYGLPWEFAPLASAFNVMASRLAEREREMIATNDRLMVMASIDIVSGLANRRGFQSRLEFEWMKALQTDATVSLLMVDVDHFKMFNDTYGHPEGDVCLSRVGRTMAQIADESSGFAARYGGEEFCLLLPGTDPQTAINVGERLRAAIELLAIPHLMSPTRALTVSIGVASITPVETQLNDDLIEAADAALYAAKRRGRNTVVAHTLTRAGDEGILRAG